MIILRSLNENVWRKSFTTFQTFSNFLTVRQHLIVLCTYDFCDVIIKSKSQKSQKFFCDLCWWLAVGPYIKGDRQIDIMQLLLDHGADPNTRDYDNSIPFHHSSWWDKGRIYVLRRGTVEGTPLLLKHGAIIDAEDNEGRTPLQLGLEHGRHDIAACLLEHGATRWNETYKGTKSHIQYIQSMTSIRDSE